MQFADYMTRKPDNKMLQDARHHARLTQSQASDLCGLHRTSYTRQESGQSKVNCACYRLIAMVGGWLIGKDFEGWHIDRQGDKLWSPEDVSFTPGEIRAIPYLYAIIADYERQLDIQRNNTMSPPNVIPFRSRK
ncbi:MAG: hypothetical protein KZQ94_20875 [Candidatus Thiodiazotropha sp. (ex Troendleina suluensis)]|nr:hypothetical protein [Candidatus Thiodiazotropha sp. (ex Troendleina suluensis)]